MKLFESELRVLETLWKEGDLPAKTLAVLLGDQVGWNKNTTYTVIKRCIDKGAIERIEPGFLCHALISREEAQAHEVDELVDRMFGGSKDLLFASLLGRKRLPDDVLRQLKRMVEESEHDNP